MIIAEPIPACLSFIQIPEAGRGPNTSFPGSFKNCGVGIVDFVHVPEILDLIAGAGLEMSRGSITPEILTLTSNLYHDQT